MKKKLIVVFFAILMISVLSPQRCFGDGATDESIVTSGNCGWNDENNLTWRFDNGVLTVSGVGEMGLYLTPPDSTGETHVAGPWYHLRDSIRAVVIEEGVQNIQDFAFAYAHNLETVQIASTVEDIGGYAFENCISLKKIQLPSVIGIGRDAFSGCRKLETVMLGEGLRYIGSRAFFLCTSLKEISIPDSVERAEEGAFQYCNKLEKMYIGNAYEMEYWDMYDEYYKTHEGIDSNSLREIRVGPENRYLKSVDGVLFDQSGEVLIRYPKMKPDKRYTIPEGVKTIREWAFEGCTLLEQVDLPNSLERIGEGAFHGCRELKGVYIPDGVLIERNLDGGKAQAYTFMDCVNLRSASVPELVEYMFAGCRNLKNLTIRTTENSKEYIYPDGVLLNCFNLERIDFSGESSRSILLPSGLEEIREEVIYGYDFQDTESNTSAAYNNESSHAVFPEVLPEAGKYEYADEDNPYTDISFGYNGEVFLIHKDGKVTVKFTDDYDRDLRMSFKNEVESWTDVKQIKTFGYSSAAVGLKLDGTLVYTVDEDHPYAYEEVNTLAEVKLWKDIESISTDGLILIGMGKDGTVSALGDFGPYDLSEWNDIVDIAFCSWPSDYCIQLIGVTKDGKLREENALLYSYHPWLGDVDYAVSVQSTADLLFSGFIVLKEGGAVVVTDRLADIAYELSRWSNIVQIECVEYGDSYAAIGLLSDGTVVTTRELFPESRAWTNVKQILTWPYSHSLYAVDETGHILECGSEVAHETWNNIDKLYCVEGKGIVGITNDGRVLSDIELF